MLTTMLKFTGSDGKALAASTDHASLKDFQQMQRHIFHSLVKLGDDGVAGKFPPATDAKITPQLVTVISMETIGTGEHEGFYAKVTGEYHFDHKSNYLAHYDFCSGLLKEVLKQKKGG